MLVAGLAGAGIATSVFGVGLVPSAGGLTTAGGGLIAVGIVGVGGMATSDARGGDPISGGVIGSVAAGVGTLTAAVVGPPLAGAGLTGAIAADGLTGAAGAAVDACLRGKTVTQTLNAAFYGAIGGGLFRMGLHFGGHLLKHLTVQALNWLTPLRAAPKSRGVWELPPLQRGRVIEEQLGQNLPANFPVIDRFENGVATSIKSMDLEARAYAEMSKIFFKGSRYIDCVAAFQGRRFAGVNIRLNDILAKGLDLAIPPGATPSQMKTLRNLVLYGVQKGVSVRILVVQ